MLSRNLARCYPTVINSGTLERTALFSSLGTTVRDSSRRTRRKAVLDKRTSGAENRQTEKSGPLSVRFRSPHPRFLRTLGPKVWVEETPRQKPSFCRDCNNYTLKFLGCQRRSRSIFFFSAGAIFSNASRSRTAETWESEVVRSEESHVGACGSSSACCCSWLLLVRAFAAIVCA